jgi:hypothetical protein
MLLRRWERARQGDGQLVLIVGEPGLGKSRLVEEFHARLRDTPHTWGEWSCSQLLQNTPLHPIADWGRQRFGGSDVPAEKRLAELENLLGLLKLDLAENAVLLAPLLEIPLPAQRAVALSPEELRRRQLAALTNLLITGARAQPAVLALEDLHWGIRPRSTCCAESPNEVRWRRCSSSSLQGPSFGRRGVCAPITAQSRSRRLIARRCGTWSASLPPAMRCRRT